MTSSNPYFLSYGSHASGDKGRCAMEWVSYLAGEPHTDQPVCVSPVLKNFCIRLNDRLDDDSRQKLRPYLARTIGTANDGLDKQRVQMCREFLVHYALPVHLDRAGRVEAAARLRALPDALTQEETLKALRFARDEAWDAREKATGRLAVRIRAELAKRGVADAAADAAAVADAAVAAAVADAAAAVAVADADAAAAAAADADAAAAVADGMSRYLAVREAVYSAMYEKSKVRVREINAEMLPAALGLLDRMLPGEVIQVPVVSEWREVCGVSR